MANITAQDVKELREITGIGMMECKNALVVSEGDKEKALKILKEKGLAMAAKKADRNANEGRIVIKNDNKTGYMLSVCCETDFVAKNKIFESFCQEVITKYVSQSDSFLNSNEMKEMTHQATASLGEKIEITQATVLKGDDSYIGSYLHGNHKIGVLLEITASQDNFKNEHFQTMAKDICMQIAAMNPIAIRQEEIDKNVLEEQKEIFMKQMAESGKPKEIIEKIVKGKLGKFFSEQCLLEMEFVKEAKLKVKEFIARTAKETGSEIQIKSFQRFQIGS